MSSSELDTRTDALAFAAWLADDLTLTPVETHIVRVLGLRFGLWLPTIAIVRAVYRDTHHPDLVACELHSLQVHVSRLRRKLASTPWRIESRHMFGMYRLVSHD